MQDNYRSGFVSIVGRPNVGKSTLMNLLVGEKLSITAARPQTTRNNIHTILTNEYRQIVFVDTPGMHKSTSKLGDYMSKSIEVSLKDIDVVLYVVEPYSNINDSDLEIIERLSKVDAKKILVINKIDTISKDKLLEVISAYSGKLDFDDIVPVSALKNKNKEELLKVIEKHLPEGPAFYPEDMITDRTERQIASEIIREKALYLLRDEIPHGIAVEITKMKQREISGLTDVEAVIYTEKDSHKGIIIGKGGNMLKKIGSMSRYDIERLLDSRVNLKLWVKVKKDWRDNDSLLKSFGYDKKEL